MVEGKTSRQHTPRGSKGSCGAAGTGGQKLQAGAVVPTLLRRSTAERLLGLPEFLPGRLAAGRGRTGTAPPCPYLHLCSLCGEPKFWASLEKTRVASRRAFLSGMPGTRASGWRDFAPASILLSLPVAPIVILPPEHRDAIADVFVLPRAIAANQNLAD